MVCKILMYSVWRNIRMLRTCLLTLYYSFHSVGSIFCVDYISFSLIFRIMYFFILFYPWFYWILLCLIWKYFCRKKNELNFFVVDATNSQSLEKFIGNHDEASALILASCHLPSAPATSESTVGDNLSRRQMLEEAARVYDSLQDKRAVNMCHSLMKNLEADKCKPSLVPGMRHLLFQPIPQTVKCWFQTFSSTN